MRSFVSAAALLAALAACAPPVPDSGAGVGFGDYSDYTQYRSTRDQALSGTGPVTPPPGVISPETIRTVTPLPAVSATPTVAPSAPLTAVAGVPPAASTGQSESQRIGAEAVAALNLGGAQSTAGSATAIEPPAQPYQAPITAAPTTNTRAVSSNNPGISDEQNFAAVSERESIESDRERLAAQREAYQVIQPQALPNRPGEGGPNIVQYALTTSNAPGQRVYRRLGLFNQSRYERNCASYASPDFAQEAFLGAGGPQRDKLGLDPDGDGFACAWDPRPFRRATAERR